MRYIKYFAGFALAAGMLAAGTSTASAQEWRYQPYRVSALRNDIARDRVRLNEDIRCGRQRAAARDAADLARDQRALRYRRDWR